MSVWSKAAIAVGLLVSAGLLMFSAVCPCERVPGAYLFGEEATEPVADWSFANEVPLCQLEVRSWRPHSINLNCMADTGVLYVSCSNCAGKAWSQTALTKREGRIRIGELVYPVALRRLQDDAELDRAWAARARKLAREPTPRPDHWWSFHLSSR